MKKPRILFVAMIESVHTARWLNEVQKLNWDIHIFPSSIWKIHPAIKNVTIHDIIFQPETADKSVHCNRSIPFIWHNTSDKINMGLQLLRSNFTSSEKYEKYCAEQLVKVIKRVKPDIIHTLEMQHAGYLTVNAKNIMKNSFPPWIYTPWGNDIYFFGRLPNHVTKIKEVLTACDYYIPKSDRDITLAKEFGFKGEFLTKLPGNGGLNTGMRTYWQPGKCSERKIIMVKGYQGPMNRALVALRAIERCSDILKDYSIIVYFAATEDVKAKVTFISQDTGLQITILPTISHEDMLKLYGKARISISANISDGVSNSLLESMVMGTFPIESNTSCANEWITHKKTGFLISPEDPEDIIEAIRFAIKNDDLIDQSAEINFQITKNTVDKSIISPKIITLYTEILEKTKKKPAL